MGFMSLKSRRKIEKAINWLMFKAKVKYTRDSETGITYRFHVNFITLTLPAIQIHPDSEITNRILGNWLEVAKKRFGLKNYVWKAESQRRKGFDWISLCHIGVRPYRINWFGLKVTPRIILDSGNIHYHIVSDTYIDHRELRDTWNKSCELLGYVSRYAKKWHHRNPNSTDVHSVKNIRNVASYVACYMSKNQMFECIGKLVKTGTGVREILYGSDEFRAAKNWRSLGKVVGSILGEYHRPIASRLWGCSRSLSRCKPVSIGEDMYEWTDLTSFLSKSDFKSIKLDKAHLLCGKVSTQSKVLYPELYTMLSNMASGTG